MIYRQFELHNVADVRESRMGLRLYRFPKPLCDSMGCEAAHSTYGRYVSQTTTGCEIRFVTEGDRALIALSSLDQDGYVEVYRGDFRYYTGYTYLYPIKKGQTTTIELIKSPAFEALDPSLKRKAGGFSPDVWRIVSDINFTMTLVDFEDYGFSVRPPRPDEMPAKTLLCYGTSLTYGACASSQSICFCQLLGRLLNVNLLNKGMGGSCMNEAGVADYFASPACQFDALLLENAVNMGAHTDEYEARCTYLIDRLTAQKPHVPIYMMTCFPNGSVAAPLRAAPVVKKELPSSSGNLETDAAIRRLSARYPQVTLIEGANMLTDFTSLTCDLVHLSDYGHIEAAHHLASALQGNWLHTASRAD